MTIDRWNILVGVDGSEKSEDALQFGRQIAGAVGGHLLLGSVYRYRALGGRLASGERAAAIVAEARRRVHGHCATRIIPAPSAADGLLHIAQREHAHLIVLGSRHRGRLGEALAGEVARTLLADGRHAVAVAPTSHRRETIARMGVLADTSVAGQAALLAADLIANDTGAVLHVQGLPHVRHPHAAGPTAVADELAQGALDLLVVGARPHGLLGRLRRRAATTSGVPHDAACPLIVVPAAAHLPVADASRDGASGAIPVV
jgi:nucleotide-binding universal stress UspA family protein